MYKILVIGAVTSTVITIESILRHKMDVVAILGHEPLDHEKVSGWCDLKSLALRYHVDYKGFSNINDISNIEWAYSKNPDIIFAVGFSQILSRSWLALPKIGCIGFHPTCLPKGRGRAPIAWIILEERMGSASFFLMGEGTDDGPVFVQHKFELDDDDDATLVEKKICNSISVALDEWLPELKKGIWNPVPQNNTQASWYGKRYPEDGLIDWNSKAVLIDRLIKSATKPHPGAYTYFKNYKCIIWSSKSENDMPVKGVVGRILLRTETGEYLVQCGEGKIWITDIDLPQGIELRVGDKLGYVVEDDINKIWKEINKLKRNE
jgi:methionyl-tRNA formyltransferase